MTNLSDANPYELDQVGARTLIDYFVERIKSTGGPAFVRTVGRDGDPDFMATPTGQFLPHLRRMYNCAIREDADTFGEKLRVFRNAWQGIEAFGTTYLYESEGRYLIPEEVMNLLVKRIRGELEADAEAAAADD